MPLSWERPKRRWGWGAAFVLATACLAVPPVRGRAEALVNAIGAPLAGFVQARRVQAADAVARERAQWQERTARLVLDQTRLQALEEENRLLRQQARVAFDSGFEPLGAQVVSRSFAPDRAVLAIDRGQRDGLEIGQPVLAGDGFLVGKVRSLTARTATVELLTDPRSRVAATLSGADKVLGVVEGRGNGAARMTYVPASQGLQKDQIIVTSGTEEKIPPHLPLGLVNAVEGKNTDPFVSAILEPLLPLDRLRFVTILRPRGALPPV